MPILKNEKSFTSALIYGENTGGGGTVSDPTLRRDLDSLKTDVAQNKGSITSLTGVDVEINKKDQQQDTQLHDLAQVNSTQNTKIQQLELNSSSVATQIESLSRDLLTVKESLNSKVAEFNRALGDLRVKLNSVEGGGGTFSFPAPKLKILAPSNNALGFISDIRCSVSDEEVAAFNKLGIGVSSVLKQASQDLAVQYQISTSRDFTSETTTFYGDITNLVSNPIRTNVLTDWDITNQAGADLFVRARYLLGSLEGIKVSGSSITPNAGNRSVLVWSDWSDITQFNTGQVYIEDPTFTLDLYEEGGVQKTPFWVMFTQMSGVTCHGFTDTNLLIRIQINKKGEQDSSKVFKFEVPANQQASILNRCITDYFLEPLIDYEVSVTYLSSRVTSKTITKVVQALVHPFYFENLSKLNLDGVLFKSVDTNSTNSNFSWAGLGKLKWKMTNWRIGKSFLTSSHSSYNSNSTVTLDYYLSSYNSSTYVTGFGVFLRSDTSYVGFGNFKVRGGSLLDLSTSQSSLSHMVEFGEQLRWGVSIDLAAMLKSLFSNIHSFKRSAGQYITAYESLSNYYTNNQDETLLYGAGVKTPIVPYATVSSSRSNVGRTLFPTQVTNELFRACYINSLYVDGTQHTTLDIANPFLFFAFTKIWLRNYLSTVVGGSVQSWDFTLNNPIKFEIWDKTFSERVATFDSYVHDEYIMASPRMSDVRAKMKPNAEYKIVFSLNNEVSGKPDVYKKHLYELGAFKTTAVLQNYNPLDAEFGTFRAPLDYIQSNFGTFVQHSDFDVEGSEGYNAYVSDVSKLTDKQVKPAFGGSEYLYIPTLYFKMLQGSEAAPDFGLRVLLSPVFLRGFVTHPAFIGSQSNFAITGVMLSKYLISGSVTEHMAENVGGSKDTLLDYAVDNFVGGQSIKGGVPLTLKSLGSSRALYYVYASAYDEFKDRTISSVTGRPSMMLMSSFTLIRLIIDFMYQVTYKNYSGKLDSMKDLIAWARNVQEISAPADNAGITGYQSQPTLVQNNSKIWGYHTELTAKVRAKYQGDPNPTEFNDTLTGGGAELSHNGRLSGIFDLGHMAQLGFETRDATYFRSTKDFSVPVYNAASSSSWIPLSSTAVTGGRVDSDTYKFSQAEFNDSSRTDLLTSDGLIYTNPIGLTKAMFVGALFKYTRNVTGGLDKVDLRCGFPAVHKFASVNNVPVINGVVAGSVPSLYSIDSQTIYAPINSGCDSLNQVGFRYQILAKNVMSKLPLQGY